MSSQLQLSSRAPRSLDLLFFILFFFLAKHVGNIAHDSSKTSWAYTVTCTLNSLLWWNSHTYLYCEGTFKYISFLVHCQPVLVGDTTTIMVSFIIGDMEDSQDVGFRTILNTDSVSYSIRFLFRLCLLYWATLYLSLRLYHEIPPYRPLVGRYRALFRYGKAGNKWEWAKGEYFTILPLSHPSTWQLDIGLAAQKLWRPSDIRLVIWLYAWQDKVSRIKIEKLTVFDQGSFMASVLSVV